MKNLKPAPPIEEGYQNSYSTVCIAIEKPLDTFNGFLAVKAGMTEEHPWQDRMYVSTRAALEGTGLDRGIRVHPAERLRLEEMKKDKT